jgi:multisubunit Na+/H+ antiporter MnhC subunit
MVVIKKVLMKRRNLFKKITSLRIFKNAINTFQELSKILTLWLLSKQ